MRRGVALLITLFMLMLISVAIGAGLHELNKAQKIYEKERFLIQSTFLIEDVMHLLRSSNDIQAIVDTNSSEAFYALVSSLSFIPMSVGDYKVLISITSARDRINVNNFAHNHDRIERLRSFFLEHELQGDLVEYLLDAMNGIKVDGSYRSDLFFSKPQLFRDYIASSRHLDQILDSYAQKNHTKLYSKLQFDKLFSFEKGDEVQVDLNFATPLTWELITGVDSVRAKELSENGGRYTSLEDLGLTPEQERLLQHFPYSFYEPILRVHVEFKSERTWGGVEFEYDLKTKKASHFVYII